MNAVTGNKVLSDWLGIAGSNLALLFIFLFSTWLNVELAFGEPESRFMTSGLRGIYLSPEKNKENHRTIGKLGIFFLQQGVATQERFDHPFQQDDQFRLEISSNRNGWLYIMHRQEGEDPKAIWPRIESGHYLDENQIVSGRAVMIPPEPLAFNFDENTGLEYFYVVISQERQVPALAAVNPNLTPPVTLQKDIRSSNASTDDYRIDEIVNFTTRGCRGTANKAIQSVVSYPGRKDNDKYIYFSPPIGENETPTMIEFQLRHE